MADINKIADILSIPAGPNWEVVRSNDDLHLIHYTTSSAEFPEYGHIRGTIVSTEYNCVVANSYGYTPVGIADEIEPDDNGLITIDDVDRSTHTFNVKDASFHMGFDGTLIRVFKWKGTVYYSTHRRLDIATSRWGNETKTFKEMYEELNGPETLFGDGDCSPYCHMFIMCHPDVVVGTRFKLTKGLLIYLGYKQMWDPETPPMPAEMVDTVLTTPDLITEMSIDMEQPVTFKPKTLSLEEANKHLLSGFWSHDGSINKYDPRLGTGEFVIVHYTDVETGSKKLVRIHSTAYEWRHTMRGNHPNLWCQFVRRVNGSYLDCRKTRPLSSYVSSYPILANHSDEEIMEHINTAGNYTIWHQNKHTDISQMYNRQNRLRNIWLCYLISVPLHRQAEVFTYLNKFYKERDNVIDWLQELEELSSLEGLTVSDRAIQIINETRLFAHRNEKAGRNLARDRSVLTVKQMTKNNISNLIRKEDGSSLYKLMKNRQRYYKDIILANMTPEA